jgi:nicotinamidase-related amidase
MENCTMNTLEPISRSSELAKPDDCFLLIIDVQEFFMKGLHEKKKKILTLKLIHLIKLATVLNIPLIVTAEDIQKNGTICDGILQILPRDLSIYDKFIYSCWGQENIQNAIRNTNKKVAVVCGLETDVCVSQTSIDLVENGYKVFLLQDLTFSRNSEEHRIGLKRMERQGVIVSSLKSWQEEITAGIRTKVNEIIKSNRLDDISFK